MIDPGWQRRPVRTAVGLFALLAALLFGGMAVGLAIATTLGGGSVGAILVGFVYLPICLGVGMTAWRGIVLAWLASGLVRAAARSGGDEERLRDATREHHVGIREGGLPGTWVFVPIASAVSLVAALAMLLLSDGNRLGSAAATLVVGIAYGVLLRRLATGGWLPVPEE